jgi:hypothetical protein
MAGHTEAAIHDFCLALDIEWWGSGAHRVVFFNVAGRTYKRSRSREGYAAHFALTHTFWLTAYPAIGQGVSRIEAPLTFTIAGAICLVIALLAIISRKPNRDHVHK